MRRVLVLLAFAAMALGVENLAQASFISGSQAYSASSTTSAPNNDIDSSTFTIHWDAIVFPAGPPNSDGDFVGVPGSFINVYDTTSAATLLAPGVVFGAPGYGTFTATAVTQNSLIPNAFRNIQFTGVFTPSSPPFAPGLTSSPATLSISLTQSAQPTALSPGILSASATLATQAVPEPATIVLLGTFCVPAALGLWMRRRRLSKLAE